MSFGKRETRGAEKRRAARQLANVNGSILLDIGIRIPCTIKDVSKTGALLIVTTVLGLPDQFSIQMTNGPLRRVAIQRRGSSRLGVRFI